MAEKKISRKELVKEPDEFLTFTAKTVNYFQDNPKVGVMIFAALVTGIVAVLGYIAYDRSAAGACHELFEKVFAEYQTETLSNESVPDEKWEKLSKAFDAVAKTYPSQTDGEKAVIYSGHCLYQIKDWKTALERYNAMKSSNIVKKGFGQMVMYHRGMTHLALKEHEQARLIFEELSKDDSSPYRREAFAGLARLYESMDKKKEAAQAYRQYLKMFPQAPDLAYVKTRIAVLGSQG